MWSLKRKEQKIEAKQKIKAVKLGDKFNLGPGEFASVEIPIPIEIINSCIDIPGNIGKIVARFEDKYGNIYEVETNIDIKDIIDKGSKKEIKSDASDARIIYYGPFKKRIRMILIPILIVGIVGIVAYLITDSIIPIIVGLGVATVLTIITEIFHMRVNEKYKHIKRHDDVNRIEIVKEV